MDNTRDEAVLRFKEQYGNEPEHFGYEPFELVFRVLWKKRNVIVFARNADAARNFVEVQSFLRSLVEIVIIFVPVAAIATLAIGLYFAVKYTNPTPGFILAGVWLASALFLFLTYRDLKEKEKTYKQNGKIDVVTYGKVPSCIPF